MRSIRRTYMCAFRDIFWTRRQSSGISFLKRYKRTKTKKKKTFANPCPGDCTALALTHMSRGCACSFLLFPSFGAVFFAPSGCRNAWKEGEGWRTNERFIEHTHKRWKEWGRAGGSLSPLPPFPPFSSGSLRLGHFQLWGFLVASGSCRTYCTTLTINRPSLEFISIFCFSIIAIPQIVHSFGGLIQWKRNGLYLKK